MRWGGQNWDAKVEEERARTEGSALGAAEKQGRGSLGRGAGPILVGGGAYLSGVGSLGAGGGAAGSQSGWSLPDLPAGCVRGLRVSVGGLRASSSR